MCDTFIANRNTTADGSVIFAKNSDREPNEAQNITFTPAKEYPKKSTVKCTFIEIPQVERTFAAILSRPFWMFGAEIGVNEMGVVIGNEAVFTKEKYMKKGALSGMDMLRLALERSKTAHEAHDRIINLLEQFGQGGNCSMEGKLYYHNSFIIADCKESFILETAGNHWVSKRVNDIGSISNCLTIEDDYEFRSDGLEEYALLKGYVKKGGTVNFTRDFSDKLYTYFANGLNRRSCSMSRLMKKKGSLVTADMLSILRDHNIDSSYVVGKKPMNSICMHAGGLISSQTTGSMVVKLKDGKPPLIFITGTSAPCLSIFKPHVLIQNNARIAENSFTKMHDDGVIDIYGEAINMFNPEVLWWRGEEIHRRVILNYPVISQIWKNDIQTIEKSNIDEMEKIWKTQDNNNIFDHCKKIGNNLLS